jgi:hypothetical protein
MKINPAAGQQGFEVERCRVARSSDFLRQMGPEFFKPPMSGSLFEKNRKMDPLAIRTAMHELHFHVVGSPGDFMLARCMKTDSLEVVTFTVDLDMASGSRESIYH